MIKKFEYGQKYPDVVYRQLVKKWFNDNTNSLSDADLQKFVNNAMMGRLTFQCADDIGLDDPDIDVIDHLLMDIASEKNDELINTYTDEIDWDNDYIEKYNKGCNMDKKLEARITKLEKMLSSKNEQLDDEDREKLQDAYAKACRNLSACISNLNKMYNFGDSMNLTYDIGDIIERCEKAMDHLIDMNRYIK